MQIILRDDVDNLGSKGDVVEVADGYARNYLVPRGLAFPATKGALAQAEAMRRSREVHDAQARAEAEEIARQLVPTVVRVIARAGEGGKLFGSVTSADVAAAVQADTHLEIDRRSLQLDEPLKELGTHQITVRLHPEVEFPLTVEIAEA